MGETIQNNPDYSRLLHDQRERLKELACINRTTSILKKGKTIEEALHEIVLILPAAWQYPEKTVARISFMGQQFDTADFRETQWRMSQDFTAIDNEAGTIEVFYTQQFPNEKEGPFLTEERDLIRNLANILAGYINSYKAIDIIKPKRDEASGKKFLQKFLDRHNSEGDIFHDLMPYKVKEILLIANLYDAYSIEGEGRFTDLMPVDYYRMSLTSMPRLTGVSGEAEAFEKLKTRHYDLIILMIGVEKEAPLVLCRKIKARYPYIPLFLLLNNPCDAAYVKKQKGQGVPFDNFFVWTGESKVFFAMVNLLEDRVNADNDTKKGPIRIILLVEDSSRYFSRYLPMLYQLVLEQTRDLIGDVSADEIFKALKLRGRPKILLASDYEEALSLFSKYRENLLCVISDMRFPKSGVLNDNAGFELLSFIKKELPGLPAVLQSSDPQNARYAHILKSSFINKNSETLLQDLKSFINYYLGFGHFNFRDNKGGQIAVARSMKEFETYLQTVPEDSLLYHATRNHFSLWLMARGEVEIAKMISPLTVNDFKSLREMREYLVKLIQNRRKEINRGKVVNFEESASLDETNVVSLAGGSLGGKGRGLAFINSLIYSFEIGKLLPGINIKTPVTVIIGTDEFDMFMDRNHLRKKTGEEKDFNSLQMLFINGSLSYTLEKKLRILIKQMTGPLAVRSSSLFEDSASQPFSGIYSTYLLPNNDSSSDIRLKQLAHAIKLVFCSIYSDKSRIYFDAIGYKLEQEKMAVVIQSVVGNRYENVFYPHMSGTAQSFNFYPVSHMTPEDGVAIAAVGLGQYVMEGEKAYRFSPAYPSTDVVSQDDLYMDSQVKFYAVNMAKARPDLMEGENAGLVLLDISEAERHGTIVHSASVLNRDNDIISAGLDKPGPRIINFADILRYNYIPLPSTIKTILDIVKEAIGTPVEIEFAVDLKKDEEGKASFYLLQIKPLVGNSAGYSIDPGTIDNDDVVLLSVKSMGNGVIGNISDIIYAKPEPLNRRITVAMAEELGRMNEQMRRENRKYVLIGPGRWGSRDTMIGIPVTWPQISNARVIVEINIPGTHLDASLGSHFFHNVTSMNVGYFSVNEDVNGGKVSWDLIEKQTMVSEGKFFRHVSFANPLLIRMDGRKGMSVISLNK